MTRYYLYMIHTLLTCAAFGLVALVTRTQTLAVHSQLSPMPLRMRTYKQRGHSAAGLGFSHANVLSFARDTALIAATS